MLITLTLLFFAVSAFYLAIQSPGIQRYLTGRLTAYFSRNLHLNLHIGGVDFSLFNKILLEDIWLEDQKGDTLAYATQISARLSHISLRNKDVEIAQLGFNRLKCVIKKDSSGIFNFQFLTETGRKDTAASAGWAFRCNNFRLKNSGFIYREENKPASGYDVSDINFRIERFFFSRDSISFNLASLTLADSKGFFLTDLSAGFLFSRGKTSISHLTLQTLNSDIRDAFFTISRDSIHERNKKLKMDLTFNKATFGLADLAIFVPALEGMDEKLKVSGEISGDPGNLKARNLTITAGKNTEISCNLNVNIIEGVQEPFIFLDLKSSRTDFTDLSSFRLPRQMKTDHLRFPANLYQAGIISYRGNFTGFLSDFVAFGTIDSKMGRIKTDLSFVPAENGRIQINGKLETADFDLGNLIKTPQVGNITLNGMVNGYFFRAENTFDADFNGTIDKLEVNRYNYSNIRLNGKISKRKFDGNAVIDDPNLKLNFSGLLNLNEKVPQFDFILNLKKANLFALGLDTLKNVSDLSLNLTANFTGSSLDNFDGLIQVFNAKYSNPANSLLVKNLTVNTHLEEKNSRINLNSDFVDATIEGTYHFKSLFDSFRQLLATYLPALGAQKTAGFNTNMFNFEVNGKNLDSLTSVFLPEWKIATPFTIRGKIDSNISTFEMNGKLPGIQYKQFSLNDIGIDISPSGKSLKSGITFAEAVFLNGLKLKNLVLAVKAGDNLVQSDISWDNHSKNAYKGEIYPDIYFTKDSGSHFPMVRIDLQPSFVVISDSVWKLAPSTVMINSSDISVTGFSVSNGNQEIILDGKVSKDRVQQLSVALHNLNLASVTGYLRKPLQMKGMINGTVGISDFYGQRIFSSDLSLKGFNYMDQPVGNASLVTQYDRQTEQVEGELKIEHYNRNTLLGSGTFNPKTRNLNIMVNFDNQPLDLLGTVIRETFSNFHGNGSGKVKITGTPEKIKLDGAVYCINAGLTIDFTRVSYNLTDSIRFSGDRIIFRNIEVSDITGNKGVFNGTIRHDSFTNMDFDLSVTSNKILALNTTSKDLKIFNGKAVTRGSFYVRGHDTDVKLSGELTSLPETSVTIELDDDLEVAKYDFIKFVQAGKEPVKGTASPLNNPPGSVEIDLLVHATPEAKAQLIYNTQISDIIKAQGEGTLRFGMDKAGNISLSGNFTVEQGEYLFTLQDVIKRRFTVERGGSITWSGDPYNAVLDLKAVYKLKASIYELMGSVENISNKQRIPVECVIMLTGDLIRPDIKLNIVFPAIEEQLRDELQQFFSTQEDMNRQILSLLVLGKFYTPDFIRGSYTPVANSTNFLGNTASDLFSSSLSNWLSQINKDVNVGFNYRPGNQLTNDEIELALSTQIFNDRVRINGNIGNNVNPNKSANNDLIGDFEIEVKLTQNGKLQLKAYNRSNNNLIYETAPYTQGLGISYKEDFNNFTELWKKFVSLFKK